MKTHMGMPASARALLAVFELDKGAITRDARLILVECHHDDEWVVSVQYRHPGEDWDRSWGQGHYFQDLEAARDYFVERCAKRA